MVAGKDPIQGDGLGVGGVMCPVEMGVTRDSLVTFSQNECYHVSQWPDPSSSILKCY